MIPDFLHRLRPTIITLLGMLQLRPFHAISGIFQNISVILIRHPVEIAVRQAMVKELNCSPTPENLKRLKGAIFDCNNPLDAYATKHMAELFDLILKNGRDRAESFLVKDPVYIEMQE